VRIVDSILTFQAIAHLGANLPIRKAFAVHFKAFTFLAVALEMGNSGLRHDHVDFGLKFFGNCVETDCFLHVRLVKRSRRWWS